MNNVISGMLTIAGWGAGLIFAYLLFTQSKGAVAVENSTFTGTGSLIAALQARNTPTAINQ